ncbi:MAG: HD domain-containing protein [Planctomycetes bacterium]|nr:HD domain-containing protein [Planctomycetota bacterium]
MAHLFVKDIKPGSNINDIYLVTQPVLRPTTKGDLYIAMYLSDRTGKVNCRMWQATESLYQQIPSEGFIQIRGKSELYQNALQIVVNDIQVVSQDKVNLADYMARTEKDVPQMYARLKEILGRIVHPQLKALVDSFLYNKDLMILFCNAPAAMQMHHNFLGGLLEHTLNMMEVAEAIFPLYPKIQKDLVRAAVFLHDIAKTKELSYKAAISYTDTGQLLGHIVLGTQMVSLAADKLAAAGKPVDAAVLDSLLHIMITHHGAYEFGSPKLPATPEAFMVSYIDNLDAKMNQTTTLIENDSSEGNWTAYQKSLETKLYRTRALEQ